jgi:hypothetical protein
MSRPAERYLSPVPDRPLILDAALAEAHFADLGACLEQRFRMVVCEDRSPTAWAGPVGCSCRCRALWLKRRNIAGRQIRHDGVGAGPDDDGQVADDRVRRGPFTGNSGIRSIRAVRYRRKISPIEASTSVSQDRPPDLAPHKQILRPPHATLTLHLQGGELHAQRPA